MLLQTKEDFPGNTKKLVDDIKTAGWEGGKVLICLVPSSACALVHVTVAFAATACPYLQLVGC